MKDVFPFYRLYYDRLLRNSRGKQLQYLIQAVLEYGLFGLEPQFLKDRRAFEDIKEMIDIAGSGEEQNDEILSECKVLRLKLLAKEQQYKEQFRALKMEEQKFQLRVKNFYKEEEKIRDFLKSSNIVL